MCEDEAKWGLGFSCAIELNIYVNESLGFISDVMLRETDGYSYAPDLQRDISVHDLEVVNLLDMSIVATEDILDGRDVDELPPHQGYECDNKIEFVYR